jgi:DNA mismatch repair ATPase MutS
LIDATGKIPFMQHLKADSRKEGGNIVYTYKIIPGDSRTSDGLYLARQLEGDKQGLMKILEENGKIVR